MSFLLRRSGILFCLVGPTGCGKTTFCEQLLAKSNGDMSLSVSVTSRARRPPEREGQSYYFVQRADFEAKIANDEFFEWEEVHGQLYGTLKCVVETAVKEGRDLLLDVDIKGALNIRKKKPKDAVIVFIAPPSFQILKERLMKRGAVSQAEMEVRFETARREYEMLLKSGYSSGKVDYLVVNDVMPEALRLLEAVVAAERARLRRQQEEDVRLLCAVVQP